MTELDSIKFLKMALAINGIALSEKVVTYIFKTVKAVQEKGGAFSVEDAVKIAAEIENK